MDISLTCGLLNHAIDRENEDKMFGMWGTLYPLMELGKIQFRNFNDYKNDIFKPQARLSQKTSEEIMNEFDKIISQHEGR